MKDYDWYEIISNSEDLNQGDFIENCPIIRPPFEIKEGAELDIEVDLINSIILSQSCDLSNDKIDIVLVCPFIPLEYYLNSLQSERNLNKKEFKKAIENLKKGNQPGYHLLNKSPENNLNDYVVVDFRNVYGIHVNNLRKIAHKIPTRLRLLPPYREHLSQAFARYFMRVGLPQDIEIEGYY